MYLYLAPYVTGFSRRIIVLRSPRNLIRPNFVRNRIIEKLATKNYVSTSHYFRFPALISDTLMSESLFKSCKNLGDGPSIDTYFVVFLCNYKILPLSTPPKHTSINYKITNISNLVKLSLQKYSPI